jgi:cephalosporin-C deacetylase-like acetyl esterase
VNFNRKANSTLNGTAYRRPLVRSLARIKMMTTQNPGTSYPTEPIVNKGELPNPFITPGDGGRISRRDEWPACARLWRDMIIDLEYGGMPPAPESLTHEILCHNNRGMWPGKPNFWSYKVHCTGGSKDFSFTVQILFPNQEGPVPAIINGDGCWWPVSDEIALHVVEAGCALVLFNRTEMAEDQGYYKNGPDQTRRSGGLYDVYPDTTFGALSAWAWGYSRCVDLLYTLPFIDTDKIAVSGHSRGGKTTLLAALTDERITLVNDNASCAGGGATYRYVGNGGENLHAIVSRFPSWFSAKMQQFIDKEDELPFDQHCLLASLAPRPVLLSYALDDRWSNPEGMVQCAWAAGEIYRFLAVPDNLVFHLRGGGHSHSLEDWDVLLDFIAWKWLGEKPKAAYNSHPYVHLEPAFSWKAPGA